MSDKVPGTTNDRSYNTLVTHHLPFPAILQQLRLASLCKIRTDQKISLREHLIYAT